MTAVNFNTIMDHVFREEGGYVDHPADPGGATNMGITHITLAEYRGKPVTKADVRNLTRAEAREIYRKRYWNVIRGDDLPSGIDLVMMDGSVNSGVGRGPKWVQAALGVVQDGKVGPATIAAAKRANAAVVINAACEARMKFLRGLKTFNTFGRGWTARVERVRKEALALANAPYLAQPKPIVLEPTPHLGPKEAIIVHDAEPITTETGKTPIGVAWAVGGVVLAGVVYFILKQMGIAP